MTKYLNKLMKSYSSRKRHSTQINTSEDILPNTCNTKTTDIKNFRSNDPWTWDYVLDEEVYDLLKACYAEVKLRGVMIPLVFLPFRPMSNVLSTKTFIRKFFSINNNSELQKDQYIKELPLTDIYVIIGIIRWCWLRLIDGVVGWNAYEAFTILEKDTKYPYNAFFNYMPVAAGSKVRENIIFDFFDILSTIAAYSKINGLCGDKLSRTAGWWAFNFKDKEQGFHKAYSNWKKSADANEHLFFAYLRSIKEQSNDTKLYVPNSMPLSLVKLLEQTPYPLPISSSITLHYKDTLCVDMLVNVPSPNAFTVLQRVAIQGLDTDDEIVSVLWKNRNHIENALTDESKRILMCISNTLRNISSSTGSKEWEKFMNFGFDYIENELKDSGKSLACKIDKLDIHSENNHNEHFNEEPSPGSSPTVLHKKESSLYQLLPCNKPFLPINEVITHSKLDSATKINTEWLNESTISNKCRINLDESFWGVWIDSCSEETPIFRKKTFGKSVLFEIELDEKKWVIVEEQNTKHNRCISFDSFHTNSSIENKQKFIDNINKYKESLPNDQKIKRSLSEYFKYQKNKLNIIHKYKSIKTKKSAQFLEHEQDIDDNEINKNGEKHLYNTNESIEKADPVKSPYSYKRLEYMVTFNNSEEQNLPQIKQKEKCISNSEIEKEGKNFQDLNVYSYSLSTNKKYGILNKFNLEISNFNDSTSNIPRYGSKLSSKSLFKNKRIKDTSNMINNIQSTQESDTYINISNSDSKLKRLPTLKKYRDKIFRSSKYYKNSISINDKVQKDN
ncbi:hypothetical protein PORY_002131 [Pneumocystis oryctolagi]|uniref:Uncharacterized protein n=1 Tax=Pneumocystis oryctolagi TaxID=42067 RepID=A0ACB7CA54_9ASCO|nr:hypothetical protein PORY_002131 [Pneumocystis oryctolagi]